jgi:diguanylate cyclase (GGDEF)-like protein
MYYSSIGILAIVIHLIINIEAMVKPRDGVTTPIKSRYRAFLWAVVLYYLADITWGVAYESKKILLAYLDTTLFFLSMSLTVLLWLRFIITYLNRKSVFNDLLRYAGISIFVFQVLTLVVNPVLPIMYRFGEDGAYYPGQARYITLGLQTILFTVIAIYTLVGACREDVGRKERLHYLATGFSGIVMTIFIILQTMFEFLPLYAMGCMLATCIIHTYVMMDRESDWDTELGNFRDLAYKDPLTHVKNRAAFMEKRAFINRQIRDNVMEEFGLVVFDLNDLKTVNDTLGHDAGDRYIKNASHLICSAFKHSPVYRVGGDEFVALLEGDDYRDRFDLLKSFDELMEENLESGEVVISSGLDEYIHESDHEFDSVFDRADRRMYERKKELKSRKA